MNTAQINASAPVLSPSVGYGIVLGMGLGFAVLMLTITKLTTRYGEHSASESSEEYTSASRSLKPGLIASGIVSAGKWTCQTFFDGDLDPVQSYLGGDPSAGVDSLSCVRTEWPMVVCGRIIDTNRTL
jgi:hypothetical protein